MSAKQQTLDGFGFLSDILFPGTGTVIVLLAEIGKRCKETSDQNFRVQRTYNRLNDIKLQLEKILQRKQQAPKFEFLQRYVTLLDEFCSFLNDVASWSFLKKLIQLKQVNEKLLFFNDEIDHVVRLMQLNFIGNDQDWKTKYAEDKKHDQNILLNLVNNNQLLMKQLSNHKRQTEAMLVLMKELRKQSSNDDEENQKLLKTAYLNLSSISRQPNLRLPPWFIHEGEVEYDVEPFAHGSFGKVHRGTLYGHTEIVVKVLLEDTNGAEQRAFEREMRLWYTLNHPFILRMFGACHVGSPPFIVCEYAPNGTLSEYCIHHPNQVLRLLYQAAQALCYLHTKSIVHGDLKCNNILVGAANEAKLSDFGLSFMRAKVSSSRAASRRIASRQQQGHSEVSAIQSGAVRWQAPECARGGRPTFSSDIYSLGMCLYEAVTGSIPYEYIFDEERVCQFVTQGRLPDRPLDKNMSDELWNLFLQMCKPNPAERLSAKDLLDQLKVLAEKEEQAAIQAIPSSQKISYLQQPFYMGPTLDAVEEYKPFQGVMVDGIEPPIYDPIHDQPETIEAGIVRTPGYGIPHVQEAVDEPTQQTNGFVKGQNEYDEPVHGEWLHKNDPVALFTFGCCPNQFLCGMSWMSLLFPCVVYAQINERLNLYPQWISSTGSQQFPWCSPSWIISLVIIIVPSLLVIVSLTAFLTLLGSGSTYVGRFRTYNSNNPFFDAYYSDVPGSFFLSVCLLGGDYGDIIYVNDYAGYFSSYSCPVQYTLVWLVMAWPIIFALLMYQRNRVRATLGLAGNLLTDSLWSLCCWSSCSLAQLSKHVGAQRRNVKWDFRRPPPAANRSSSCYTLDAYVATTTPVGHGNLSVVQ